MSKLITLNTKKNGVFDNYFEDTFTIPKNAEVALIKTLGMNVKYESYEYLIPPPITPAHYTVDVLRFCCDGVNVNLNWKNIYNAYASFDVPGLPAPESTFFSGNYRWTLNPSVGGNVVESICKALSDKLTFYEIQPNCDISYDVNYGAKPCYTKFGITSTYDTNKRLNPATIDDFIGNIGGLNVYKGNATTQAGSLTTTAADTVVYSGTNIAQNGGMLNFRVKNDKELKIGVTFDNQFTAVVAGTVTDPYIDFGVHVNANGANTYNIIRNNQSIPGTQGFTGGTETFSIVFSRVNQPESEDDSDYHAFLLQSYFPSGASQGDFQDFTVARQAMTGGYCPSFICDAPEDGTIVDNIKVIEAEAQDQECRTFMTRIQNPTDVGVGGTAFRNSHSFILVNPSTLDDDERELTLVFFQTLGFLSFNSSKTATKNEQFESYANEDNNKLVIQTQLRSHIEKSQVIYIATNVPAPIDEYTPEVNDKILPEPFPYLQFHMETLNTISLEGNYFKQDKSRQQNTATKVLMNIPVGDKKSLSESFGFPQTYISYDYETYTPYYVALNNPEPIPVNQIKCRLATPKNIIVDFDNFDGTSDALCMLHFRKSLATEE